MINRPSEEEYAPFYAGYVSLVPEDDILPALERQPQELAALAAEVRPDHETYRYEKEKWSLREVFGHLGDAERVFGYRLFCIGRGDQTSLPGFDERQYVARSHFDRVPLGELADEFSTLRRSNLSTIRRLQPADWARVGTANNAPVSVRALAFIMTGHVRHHMSVVRTRYAAALNG